MAVNVKHKFVSAKADDIDTTLINPSNWNDTHALEQTSAGILGSSSAGTSNTNVITVGQGLNLTGSTLKVSELRTTPAISAGTLTIDLSAGTVYEVSLNANITTLTLTNVATAGIASSFVLVFTADGTARTVAWPASFKWPAAEAPVITSTSGKKDVFVFFTTDAGTSWQAFVAGQDM